MAPTTIPARHGAHVRLLPGQTIKLINPHGTQVIDFWAITPPAALAVAAADPNPIPRSFIRANDEQDTAATSPPPQLYPYASGIQYLSMSRTRSVLMKLAPSATTHDVLYTNKTQPLFTMVSDTTQHGIHDTLFGCCDRFRYHNLASLGYSGVADNFHHASCAENLHVELQKSGLGAYVSDEWTPDPLNVFMNVPVTALNGGEGGDMGSEPPTSRPGEYLVLKAEREVWCFMSACPNDVIKGVNDGRCLEAEFEVGE